MVQLTSRDPFEDLIRGFFVRPVDFGGRSEAPSMRVDVRENAESYLIDAELPGLRKEDIQVNIEGDSVTIVAERSQAKPAEDAHTEERVLRSERNYGRYSRSFRLQQEVDEERAQARYLDGVLSLSLPKKALPSARKLSIQ